MRTDAQVKAAAKTILDAAIKIPFPPKDYTILTTAWDKQRGVRSFMVLVAEALNWAAGDVELEFEELLENLAKPEPFSKENDRGRK